MAVTLNHILFEYHTKPKEALPIILITKRCYLFMKYKGDTNNEKRIILENKYPSIF